MSICSVAAQKFGVACKSAHLASISFAFEGKYLGSEPVGSAEQIGQALTSIRSISAAIYSRDMKTSAAPTRHNPLLGQIS